MSEPHDPNRTVVNADAPADPGPAGDMISRSAAPRVQLQEAGNENATR